MNKLLREQPDIAPVANWTAEEGSMGGHRHEGPQGDLLMGADSIAAYLGVTRRQVYRLVYDDIIPSFKLGGTVAARKSSLTVWMQKLEHK